MCLKLHSALGFFVSCTFTKSLRKLKSPNFLFDRINHQQFKKLSCRPSWGLSVPNLITWIWSWELKKELTVTGCPLCTCSHTQIKVNIIKGCCFTQPVVYILPEIYYQSVNWWLQFLPHCREVILVKQNPQENQKDNGKKERKLNF